MIKLILGDCLEEMPKLEAGSVDAIIADIPYGTTACKWDIVIPFAPMWKQLKRIVKPNGAIVLFGSEPFSSALRMSNIKNYKYDWVWKKTRPTGFANAKKRPLKLTENIIIFNAHYLYYIPQGLIKIDKVMRNSRSTGGDTTGKFNYGKQYIQEFTNYPNEILEFSLDEKSKTHPTQKPVALMEYLIKTYTNEGETVLDFAFGSGTTGVACGNLNRKFIGIELSEEYFEIAEKRIQKAYEAPGFRIEC